MKYIVVMTTTKRDEEPEVKELPFHARSKNQVRKVLYFSFPYGAWFVQEMLTKRRVKVSFMGDELLINQDVDVCDMSILYELKEG